LFPEEAKTETVTGINFARASWVTLRVTVIR